MKKYFHGCVNMHSDFFPPHRMKAHRTGTTNHEGGRRRHCSEKIYYNVTVSTETWISMISWISLISLVILGTLSGGFLDLYVCHGVVFTTICHSICPDSQVGYPHKYLYTLLQTSYFHRCVSMPSWLLPPSSDEGTSGWHHESWGWKMEALQQKI